MGEHISQKSEQIMLCVKHVAHILEIVETNPDFFCLLFWGFFSTYKIIVNLLLQRSAKMLIIHTLHAGKLNYSTGNSRFFDFVVVFFQHKS